MRNLSAFSLPPKLAIGIWLTSWFILPLQAYQEIDAQKLRIAQVQHEIIQILLKEKKFDPVIAELDKILNLQLPSKYEERVVREVLIVANALMHSRRPDLSTQALERGIRGVVQPKNKSLLYKELGYIYRLQGNDVKAMESFRKAYQLARKPTIRPY